MIWKIDTKKIGGIHRVIRVRLKSEGGRPDGILEFVHNPALGMLADDDGLLRYAIEGNPVYDSNLPKSSENSQYVIVENKEPIRQYILDRRKNIELIELLSISRLAEAVIAYKNGDNSKLDELEAKMERIKREADETNE